MEPWQQNLIFTILGATLALLGGIVTEWVRQKITQKNTQRALKTVLSEELEIISAILGKLIANRKSVGSFRISYLNEISAARGGFDRNRESITFLLPALLRKPVINFYHRLFASCADAIVVENAAVNPANIPNANSFIDSQRNSLLGDFQQLETQLDTIRQQLSNWDI